MTSGECVDPPDGLTPEVIKRLIEDRRQFVDEQKIDRSSLVRVLGIAETVETEGIRVELIALEIRAAGAVLYWKAHSRDQGILGPADLAMTDDAGTKYQVLATAGSGGEQSWNGQYTVSPAPPAGRRLQIDVRKFEGFGERFPGAPRSGPVDGLWRFDVVV